MTEERWRDIVGQVKDSFPVLEEGAGELVDRPGTTEWIVFQGPLGKMKLEHIAHRYLVGEKAIGSKRIGSDQTIQKEYSDELVHKMRAYKWDDSAGGWAEMEPGRGSFISE